MNIIGRSFIKRFSSTFIEPVSNFVQIKNKIINLDKIKYVVNNEGSPTYYLHLNDYKYSTVKVDARMQENEYNKISS